MIEGNLDVIARLLSAVLGLTALILASPSNAAPLEAYGRLPTMEIVALSPDGKNLAYAQTVKGKRVIAVMTLADRKVVGAIDVTEAKLRDLAWADSRHLLITTSQTTHLVGVMASRGEYSVTMSFDVETRKTKNILVDAGKALNVIAGMPQPRVVNGKTVVFVEGVAFLSDRGRHVLFAADLDRNKAKLVESSSPHALDWVVDAQGNVVAETDYEEKTKLWSLMLKKDGYWAEAYGETSPIDMPDIEGLSPDGKSLVVSDADGDWRALKIADGTWDEEADLDYMVSNVVKDPATHLIIGGKLDGSVKSQYRFFDPQDEKAWERIALAFDGENVELESWSQDRTQIVVKVSGERRGAAFVLVDLKTNQSTLVGNVYEDIQASDVAPVRSIVYDAADGTKILAFLTVPKGRDAKKLPLVVLVHGGPASHDRPGFDWWSQAFASRGYAVLRPEFRGSTVNDKHLAAGYGEWGRKMQTDVSDGVRTLATQGVIDPARVCIVGASYGGYAALAGVSIERDIYRCAVSVAGVADPAQMMARIADRQHRSDSVTLRYWDRFMGVTGAKDPKLNEISPVAQASRVTVPVLLIHGREDTVVEFEQSERMLQALKKAGKPVEFVTLDGEDHWLSGSETRLKMLQESVRFLEANNPPT